MKEQKKKIRLLLDKHFPNMALKKQDLIILYVLKMAMLCKI